MYSTVILMIAYGNHLTAVKQMWQLANLMVMLLRLLCNTFFSKIRRLPTLSSFAHVESKFKVPFR